MTEIPPDLAPRLQLSYSRQETGAAETVALVRQAIVAGCPAVGVFPMFVIEAARTAERKLSLVAKVCPFGMSKPTIKAIEATSCIKDGATEIQLEPLLSPQLQGDFTALKTELLEIARAARATGRDVLLHATLHTSILQQTGGETWVELACRAVREGAFDGVTDTGDDSGHALLRTHAGGLILRRTLPAREFASVRAALHPTLDRVEIFAEMFGGRL